MFTILKFTLIALVSSLFLGWMLDNNGSVVVNWLGFEARTDVLTVLIIAIIGIFLILLFSYFLIKISSIVSRIFKKKVITQNDK